MRVSDLTEAFEGMDKSVDLEVLVRNDQGELFELSPDMEFQWSERRLILELTGEYIEE